MFNIFVCIFRNIDTDTVVQQLVTTDNDNAATHVKDEEIYAAMKSVCEIFRNTETADVALLQSNADVDDETAAGLISITDDDQLIDTNYLNGNVVGLDDDENITTSLEQEMLVEDHAILGAANHDLLQQNDIILSEDNNRILAITDTEFDVKNDLLDDNVDVDALNMATVAEDIPIDKNVTIATVSTMPVVDLNVSLNKAKLLPISEAPPLVPINQESRPVADARQNYRADRKAKKRKSSKILKTKEDLDHFLEQRRSKRKVQQVTNRDGEKAPTGPSGKKKKELLKMPEQCFDCGKTFAYSGYLDAHIRTHTGERPYHCHVCKLKFAQGK